MPSFQHFQNQAEQKPKESKFSGHTLSLSGLMDFAESAKKRSFESLCGLQPLLKSYRDKIEETSQAMIAAESSLGAEAEIPPDYAAALTLVKESFAVHLGSLEEWMSVLAEKRESDSDKAMAKVKQSGKQLETSLMGLSVPEFN